MIWQIDLPQEDTDRLTAKAAKDKTTVDAMLTVKIEQYLADVKRESGADVDANLSKKIAEMDDAEKLALAAQLGV